MESSLNSSTALTIQRRSTAKGLTGGLVSVPLLGGWDSRLIAEYRSAIFTHSPEQESVAKAVTAEAQEK